MEALECILTRRSVREFDKNKTINKETAYNLIRAAMYAPSAHNKKPWEFVIVDNRSILDEFPKLQQWTKFAESAPMAIIVCKNLETSYKYSETEDFADIDCAAATQNMLLAAHAFGLGACWCGVAPMADKVKDFKKLLKLPEQLDPFSIVIMGYPVKEPFQPKERLDEQKIHWNKYSED